MNWAMSARTDGVSAQCVLLVVADTANENGISVHADPDYLAERTRQSRATVFRRLRELEAENALVRFKRFDEHGAPIYEIRLNLAATVDYTSAKATADDPQDIGAESQIETPLESQPETPKVSPVRQAESQWCDSHKNPSKNPREESPPYPPPGGFAGEIEQRKIGAERLRQIEPLWPDPITDAHQAVNVLEALSDVEWNDCLTGAKGYAKFIRERRSNGQKRSVKDFHNWARNRQWAGYLTVGKQAEVAAKRVDIVEKSEEWNAWTIYYKICGRRHIPIFMVRMTANFGQAKRIANVPSQWPPVGRGLELDERKWITVESGTPQIAAWLRRLRELENAPISLDKRLDESRGIWVSFLRVPTEWPPGKKLVPASLEDDTMIEAPS